jgi:hypothetical protein
LQRPFWSADSTSSLSLFLSLSFCLSLSLSLSHCLLPANWRETDEMEKAGEGEIRQQQQQALARNKTITLEMAQMEVLIRRLDRSPQNLQRKCAAGALKVTQEWIYGRRSGTCSEFRCKVLLLTSGGLKRESTTLTYLNILVFHFPLQSKQSIIFVRHTCPTACTYYLYIQKSTGSS